MKVAIVGLGGMGSTHYNIIRKMDDAQIVALVDVREEVLRDKAAECGARLYMDLQDMLRAEKPDFVDICTPSYLHCEQAITVMQQGIHVLVEKPAALNPGDVKAMLKTAEDKNVFLMPAHVLRFWDEYVWLYDAHKSNRYGQLLDLDMWRIGQRPVSSWQDWMMNKDKSGLVPFDLHIHDIDFMVWMLGVPDNTDCYTIDGSPGQIVETTCMYKSGTRVRAKATWFDCELPFEMGFEAIFEQGFARFTDDVLTFYPNEGDAVSPLSSADFGDSEINVANTSGYYNEIRYFMDCIRKGEKPSVMKGDELLAVLEILGR